MVATITVKPLAQGQLSSVNAVLYTVPALTSAYVKFFSVNNVGSSSQIVQIFVNTGTAIRICYLTLTPNQGGRVIDKDEALTLTAGNTIEGFSTNGSVVDYVITGAEEA
jgi:hypothetical protein